MRTLLYAYYDLNVYFSKIFVTHAFLDKFRPIIWISSNWLKFGAELDCYMLISILVGFFQNFYQSFFWASLKNFRFWNRIFSKNKNKKNIKIEIGI